MDVKLTKWPDVEVGQGHERWAKSSTSVLFEVKGDDVQGRIQISEGGVRWWRGQAQKATKHVSWPDLVAFFESS